MRFHARHGVMEQEGVVGGDFTVSVSIDCPVDGAIEHDDLDGTVNYAVVYGIIDKEMRIPSHLIEHVAGRIAKAIVKQFPQITAITVEVRKDNPPMGAAADGAGVVIRFVNDPS